MVPILGRIGPHLLYSYTVFMGLGVLAGLLFTAWQARSRPLPGWPDAYLAALVGGLVGGRLGYMAAHWDYFGERPFILWWRFWQGGYAYHGALLGGLLGLWLWCAWGKRPFGQTADLFAPALALGSAFGWLACWLAACAYGRETTLGLFALAAPDEYGVFAVRYGTQLAGLVWSLLVFASAWALARKGGGNGRLFWFTLALLSLGRALISLWRGDPSPDINDWRLDTLIDSTLVLISLIMLKLTPSWR
jgi:phosphatidylglycerol---prolipoprotein diacylglyceryl transferase